VLGGVGVVGIGAFAYLGLTAKGDLDHLRQTCAPFCSSSDLDSARHEALGADIALGVGVVSLAAAAYVLLTRPSAPASTSTAHVEVFASPAGGGLRGTF
jgi:hypothetical protein